MVNSGNVLVLFLVLLKLHHLKAGGRQLTAKISNDNVPTKWTLHRIAHRRHGARPSSPQNGFNTFHNNNDCDCVSELYKWNFVLSHLCYPINSNWALSLLFLEIPSSIPVVGQITPTEVLYLTVILCFKQTWVRIPIKEPLHTIVICFKQHFMLPLNKLLCNFVERLFWMCVYIFTLDERTT